MNRFFHICIFLCLLLGMLFLFSGCGKKEESKTDAIDFTVLRESEVPAPLAEWIDKKKEQPFSCTYETKEYLYIVVGYGAQTSGDYQITVENLCRTNKAIYVETALRSKEKERGDIKKDTDMEHLWKRESVWYPVLIMKCSNYDLPVIFKQ